MTSPELMKMLEGEFDVRLCWYQVPSISKWGIYSHHGMFYLGTACYQISDIVDNKEIIEEMIRKAKVLELLLI